MDVKPENNGLTNITGQIPKKIPKKWVCAGTYAPTHTHFFGYLRQ
jgi:hypothetical protein